MSNLKKLFEKAEQETKAGNTQSAIRTYQQILKVEYVGMPAP